MKLIRNSRQGFTLVELLIVIVVVAVLVVLVVPILRYAREQSHSTYCIYNLKQIGLACASYSRDNTDRVPCGTSSVFSNAALMSNYISSSTKLLVCPQSVKMPARSFSDPRATDAANVSYTQQAPLPGSMATGMIWGADTNDVLFWDQGIAGNACGPNGGVGLSWAATGNHKGAGGNVLFNGCHVAWQTKTPTNMTFGLSESVAWSDITASSLEMNGCTSRLRGSGSFATFARFRAGWIRSSIG